MIAHAGQPAVDEAFDLLEKHPALLADLVVASEAAVFGTTEIAVGLWPMMITAEIVRNVGRKRALELMLSGRRVSAAEAASIGRSTSTTTRLSCGCCATCSA